MATALAELARQARIELLFDQNLVRGLKGDPVRGRMSGEAALSKLLAGTGVGYRATPDGVFVLFAKPTPKPTGSGDGAVAELLVVGRRTQNVDIRRTENDIQPYRVYGRSEIEAAGRDSVDEFLRVRETANTRPGPLALRGGESRSSIDLRGFGETSTLVLVDGRRMPFVPSLSGDFSQADIGGIPPGAVDRVEVLTTTAGGIYGPGAIGGVVNLVLRRDYRGADLTAYAGGSDRGDSGHYRLEGRLGFTPDHGRTDVMLFVAHSEARPLRVGRRSYVESAGRLRYANDLQAYLTSLPIRNGVSVASPAGNLTLDAAHGGESLGASFTFLPLGFSGTSAEAVPVLLANAGSLPLDLSNDLSGKRGYIATTPRATSGLLNIRRRLGPNAEVFIDGLAIRTTGRWVGATSETSLDLAPSAPGNPFDQPISVTFPAMLADETSYRYDLSRWTVGTIVDLARGWKASADYTVARNRVRQDSRWSQLALLSVTGNLDANPRAPLEPIGPWAAVAASLPAYVQVSKVRRRLDDRLHDASLRLSGPLLTLPGGPLTATIVGEAREDRVAVTGEDVRLPPRAEKVRSGYVELRAPLGALDAANPLVRGLELQVAVRHDRSIQKGPQRNLTLDEDAQRFSASDDATMFTAGARVLPTPQLMLRGSVASGERPPSLSDFQRNVTGMLRIGAALQDPRRGDRPLGSEGPWSVFSGGSTRIGSARARSVTVGLVVNPEGAGPRLSLDYSRIVVSDEPAPFLLTPEQLLAAEARYPDRVIRAPVTAADQAEGFAVGRVIALDASAINAGRTVVEAIDLQFDWRLPPLKFGDLRLYGALTWQPTFSTRESPASESIDRVGVFGGPLEWRANGGLEWTTSALTADLNVQYYGSYRDQGGAHVSPQAYVDLSLRRRFTAPFGPGPLRTLEARISIHNLLDRSPPIVAASPYLGFSEYGDPRRRRLTAALSARF